MAIEHQVFEIVVYQFGWRVVITFNLVAYHFDFFFQFVVGILTIKHHIREQFHRPKSMLFGQCSIINGILFIGECVEVATHTLQAIQYIKRRSLACTLKRCMFAKVSHAHFFGCFVACTSINLVTAIHHRRRRRSMNDAKPIKKCGRVIFLIHVNGRVRLICHCAIDDKKATRARLKHTSPNKPK